MILRLQSFFAGFLALLVAALLALGSASAKPASGGYQLFEPVALEHQNHIQLASLGNFDYHAKIASECCNAPNRGGKLFDNPSATVTTRVDELAAQIPENSRGRITMGVAVVEDAAGNRKVLVSTSEPNGYLRPGVSLRKDEVLVSGPRGSHAEADIVRYAEENGLTIVDIGATRPVCTGCQGVIPDGTNISTPLK